MTKIEKTSYSGERPLFNSHDLLLDHVSVLDGESSIKECSNITCTNSTFNGKYPFWHLDGGVIENCLFKSGARAAIWYTQKLQVKNTMIDAPKMFRKVDDLTLENCEFSEALETLWDCSDVKITNCKAAQGDYICLNGKNITVNNMYLQGNYSFQNCKNVYIRDSILDSKDAFWESENVVLENCTITGEYLGWHSVNLKLINCRISGTQPLCYATNLILENCIFLNDCDLCFEYSTVDANVIGYITSIKNPISGKIVADSIGEIIIDSHAKAPNNCLIQERLNAK